MGARGLSELIERVEALDGPSTLIDAELYATLGGAPHTTTAGGRTIPLIAKGGPRDYPSYTASLDAAIALCERVLPGWGYYLRSDAEGNGCGLVYPDAFRVTPAHCTGATPAIAVVTATLRALAREA